MRFKIFLLFTAFSIFICSCSKDELKDVELNVNFYDLRYDPSNAIKINSLYDITYFKDPITGDTSYVKIYINLNYDSYIFENDVFSNRISVANEFYLNDAPLQLFKESGTNKYYIQPGWGLIHNSNSIKFLFRFYKDNNNPMRRKLASNVYSFEL